MAEERVERRLAAILCADVAGYSRLMGEDEEGTLAALKAYRRDLIDPLVSLHQGRIVKTTGDGMLVEFASVVDAVKGAVALQQEIARRNEPVPEARRIRFRIGINLGDIIVDGDDIFGEGVNVAARLETLADPGAIFVSGAVREQLGDRLGLAYRDLGEHSVKNIVRPIHVFAITVEGAAAAAPEAPPASVGRRGMPSIAVLPFQNLSGDPEQEYFADGMVEDIITGLSHVRWLAVIARNSSFVYKGRAIDVKQVGRELDVRYVLEGSVRRAGNRVRITAQLIDAESGRHLWAERYDREFTDIFALQDEMTVAVVGAIEPNVRAAELERLKHKRPDNLDAYDLLLHALPLAMTLVAEDTEKAVPLLERAISLEPDFANAHALLARCYQVRYMTRGFRPEDRDAAIAAAHAALKCGGDNASALAGAGFVVSMLEGDHKTAIEAFERALALSPSSFMALSMSAVWLALRGQVELAVERAERALKLSPFDPTSFGAHTALAAAHTIAGRYDEAVASGQRAIQVNPRFPLAHAWLVIALAKAGRLDEAKAAARRLMEVEPGFTCDGFARFAPDETARCWAIEALASAGVPER